MHTLKDQEFTGYVKGSYIREDSIHYPDMALTRWCKTHIQRNSQDYIAHEMSNADLAYGIQYGGYEPTPYSQKSTTNVYISKWYLKNLSADECMYKIICDIEMHQDTNERVFANNIRLEKF